MSEDDQVRRLLADARHTEPLPPDVAERLDGVLADLHAERPIRPVATDLAAARRRRRARTMLIAAAAIVVVGLGVDQIRGAETSGGDDASAGSASADDAGGSTAEREGGATDLMSDDAAAEQAPSLAEDPSARVDSDDFGTKVLRLRAQRDAGALDYTSARSRCTPRGAGAGDVVPIRYDGSPAVVVYRVPRGDTQVVDLYICGRDEIARSITLPAP